MVSAHTLTRHTLFFLSLQREMGERKKKGVIIIYMIHKGSQWTSTDLNSFIEGIITPFFFVENFMNYIQTSISYQI